jgi:hypothetical protein
VDVDLENDRLHIDYDPAKLSPEDLLQAVGKQGFTATIVSASSQAASP